MPANQTDKLGVQAEFDAKSAHYESNRLSGWYMAHNDIILRHLERDAGKRLLDVGCASGYLIRSFVTARQDVTAMGIDLSPQMIAAAETLAADLGPRVTFLSNDWEDENEELDKALTQKPFDVAVCASTFHYFANPVAALRRMQQVLTPGGRLFLLERQRERSLPTMAWDLAHRHLIKDHVQFYSTAELTGMVEAAGFREAKVVETIKRAFWHGKVSTNLTLIKALK